LDQIDKTVRGVTRARQGDPQGISSQQRRTLGANNAPSSASAASSSGQQTGSRGRASSGPRNAQGNASPSTPLAQPRGQASQPARGPQASGNVSKMVANLGALQNPGGKPKHPGKGPR
jgi:hypothetical protein